ncbi:MAG TPA: hypothetical protein ENH00_10970 [Actinobacteria bacterium]|nr:hypothetical protein BMS3Bbin01_02249 [bacterium BMS3Bbin01]HDH26693.1 hypothetical protein [Actinomycetota bacterium]
MKGSWSAIVPVVLVGLACTLVFWLRIRRFAPMERRLFWGSFCLHVAATGMLYFLTVHVYGVGDMLGYSARGAAIAREFSRDLLGGVAGLVSMLAGTGGVGVFAPHGAPPTIRFTAVSGVLSYVSGGSFLGAMLLMATIVSLSMVSLYGALKLHVDRLLHSRLLVGIMFTPGVLFWSSGLLKEALAITAIGVSASGFSRWLRFKRWPRLLQAVVWVVVLLGFKSYVAVALVAAYLAWIVMVLPEARRKRLLLVAVLLGAAILIVSANSAQRYAQSWAGRFAEQQEPGAEFSGGSTVSRGVTPSSSVVGQLSNLPVGLLTVWTRPWPSDVKNPFLAVSSLQVLVLLGFGVSAFSRLRWRGIARRVKAMPVLGFCFVFGFVESIAVGLGSLNLGSIDRYRAPALLLVVPALLVLQGDLPARSGRKLSLLPTERTSRPDALRPLV